MFEVGQLSIVLDNLCGSGFSQWWRFHRSGANHVFGYMLLQMCFGVRLG